MAERPQLTAQELADWLGPLEKRRDELFVQLDSGYDAIEEASLNGTMDDAELDRWTRYWAKLLREYEQLNDEIRRWL